MATPIQFYSSKLYPRLTRGRFNTWRVAFVLLTQLIYLITPWLLWHGRPAVRFDFASMRGYLFGLALLPQDLVYLAGVLILCAIGLFLWTSLAGRVWCGFSCPQTVYSQIMLWIERWVEGPPNARRLRDQSGFGLDKWGRKSLSQLLMLLFSLWTGLTLVGYFSPMRPLITQLAQWQIGPWEALFTLGYGGFTWLLGAHLRESVCKHMCPYARFQGVMFDRDTLLVAYAETRGEPRAALRKQPAAAVAPSGDCVDCGLCVQVCPTGIDIRQGLQYECIGCAACIDVCDQVMDKLARPRGLIAFTTQRQQAGETAAPSIWRRPRTIVYGLIMLALTALMITGLATRTPFRFDVLRDRAVLARETSDGYVENAYTLHIMNTQAHARSYQLRVLGAGIVRAQANRPLMVAADGESRFFVTVAADADLLKSGSHPLRFVLTDTTDSGASVEEEGRFLLP
jgi:cytochrome c oxidase accessory protein FixG